MDVPWQDCTAGDQINARTKVSTKVELFTGFSLLLPFLSSSLNFSSPSEMMDATLQSNGKLHETDNYKKLQI